VQQVVANHCFAGAALTGGAESVSLAIVDQLRTALSVENG